jgi:cobalt-zinc-cadmium efflux system outer membrane protein
MNRGIRNILASMFLAAVSPALAQAQTDRTYAAYAAAQQQPAPVQPLSAAEQGFLTLEELAQLALDRHPILRRSMEKIESARGDAVQASLYPNPRMETNNPELFAGKASAVNFGWQQDLICKGKMRLERAAADQVIVQNKATYVQDRMGLLTAVRRQAFITMAAERRVEVLQELAGIAGRARDAAEKLEKAGEGTLTDTLFLTTEAERTYILLQNAETLSNAEHKKLAAIVGVPSLEIRDVVGDLLAPVPEFNSDVIHEFVMQQSTRVEIARADVARQQYLQKRAEVEPFPNVRCGPSFQQGVAAESSQGWFTIAVLIPVWDRNQGNIRQARAEHRASRANVEVVQNDLLANAMDVLGDHLAARERAQRMHDVILPNTVRTRQLVYDGYMKGQFDLTRLLQAQRAYTETNIELVEALERMWTTAADLAGMLQVEQFPQ